MNDRLEFEESDIEVKAESFDIDYDENGNPVFMFIFWLLTNFDIKRKFNITLKDDEYVNIFVKVNKDFTNLKMIYIINKSNDNEYNYYKLTKDEEAIIISKLKIYCEN